MREDTLEVLVNGQRAAVGLWEPYEVDLSGQLEPGDNTLELRVANTPINLLEAVPRPSGLAGPPRLVLTGPSRLLFLASRSARRHSHSSTQVGCNGRFSPPIAMGLSAGGARVRAARLKKFQGETTAWRGEIQA